MEIIFKIVAIGIITCIASMIIKPIRSDFSVMIAIIGGVIILFMIINYLTGIFSVFTNLISLTGLSSNIYVLLLKVIGIGYLIEFASGICSDTGNTSLGDKILFCGKIIIMSMALPIVIQIIEIIMEILPL